MKISIPFLLTVFFCSLSFFGNSQEYHYKHYDITNGLAGNNVYHSIEDKEGFMWFATETGVSRFDGTTFKNFTTAEGLPDNEILKLFVDSRGRVWMLPFKNTVCYYYKGKIYNPDNDSLLHRVKINDCVSTMFEDGSGDLFFLMQKSLMIIKKDGAILGNNDDGAKVSIYGGGLDSELKPLLFLGGDTHLYRVETGSGKIIYKKMPDSIRFYGNNIQYSHISPRLIVYANNYRDPAVTNSLVFYRADRHYSDTIPLVPECTMVSYESDSILFFNTNYGALKYNYEKKVNLQQFLPTEKISSLLRDSEYNLWFTTLGHGVYRLYSDETRNIYFPENNSLASVESVYANNTNIIAGTAGSKIYDFSKATRQITSSYVRSVDAAKKVIKIFPYKDRVYILGENAVYSCDHNLENIKELPLIGNVLNWTFKDMDIGLDGTMYFSTHSYGFSCTPGYESRINKFYTGRSTTLCRVDSGIYLGTLQGLLFVDHQKKVVEMGARFDLLRDRITKLLVVKDKIWIGTNDHGVICFDGKTIVKNISESNGLSGKLIRSLFASGKYLWVGTDHGLNKIDITDSEYPVLQQYNTSDGINSDMINSVYVKDDTVYVATPNGLSYFNEKKLFRSSTCKLKILGVTVSGKTVPYDSTTLFLDRNDNNIRFDFVALSFKSEGNILYYYKLSGIDPEWKTTRENFLQYPTIPSGMYEMQLYAINKFGVKSNIINISFEVQKRITETTWFLVFVLLSLIAAAILLANWRIRKLKSLQKEKIANAEKIALLEQQALKAQMNPHFIFNCLNSIQQYVIDKDVQGANKFISGFSKLIRQTLDNSGKRTITIAEEESFLRAYLDLEKSRFEDKFDYNIGISKNIRKDDHSLPPMLLQPYIENCIRHGIMHKRNGKGFIDVFFDLTEGNLVCSVTDNGIGRIAADHLKDMQHVNYQSKGTELTRQRILMINKSKLADIILKTEDLVDFNNQPCGTRVTIVIPMQNAG